MNLTRRGRWVLIVAGLLLILALSVALGTLANAIIDPSPDLPTGILFEVPEPRTTYF